MKESAFKKSEDSLYSIDFKSAFERELLGCDEPPRPPLFPPHQTPQAHKIMSLFSHLMAWIIVAGALIIPLFSMWGFRIFSQTKGRVLGASTTAVQALEEAQPKIFAFDLIGARDYLIEAHQSFEEIKDTVDQFRFVLPLIRLLYPQSKSYLHLSEAGLEISEAGVIFSDPSLFSETSSHFGLRLQRLNGILQAGSSHIEKAYEHAQQVDVSDFSFEYQPRVRQALESVVLAHLYITKALSSLEHIKQLLGVHNLQRYLFLFQNSGELRSTGGFLGSLALVDVYNGDVKKVIMPTGGSYDLQYGANKRYLSPEPFSILNPDWEIQDCNWFPDFPASAEKCAWFVEHSFGTSVDGVVAVNVQFVVDLLKLVGPIEMPEYSLVLNADNFIEFTQIYVESFENKDAPKKILVDLLPRLLERIKQQSRDNQKLMALFKLTLRALEVKDIQLNAHDAHQQEWFVQNNWAGAIPEIQTPYTDFVYVNTASLQGAKSDFGISQTIKHLVRTTEQSLRVRLTVERRHAVNLLPEGTKNISEGERRLNKMIAQPNLSYIRVYVPYGSKLVDVFGDHYDVSDLKKSSDITNEHDPFLQNHVTNVTYHSAFDTTTSVEFGKTVFGTYMLVEPGKTSRITFEYDLPFSYVSYRVYFQKQSGSNAALLSTFNDSIMIDQPFEKDFFYEVLE